MPSRHPPFSSGALSILRAIFCSTLIRIMLFLSSDHSTLATPFDDFYRSVCAFPSLENAQACQRAGFEEEDVHLLNGWFCDPGSTISMSEVFAIDETVRRIYAENGQNCVCPTEAELVEEDLENGPIRKLAVSSRESAAADSGHCWFRFGLAFVPELSPGPDMASADQCPSENNGTETEPTAENGFEPPADKGSIFAAFATNYARVLRERWRLGRCGEDILVLVVQRPPQTLSAGPLSSAHSRLFGPLPMLFVSFGSLILHRLPPAMAASLDALVRDANAQLQQDARPLFRVLNELLVRIQQTVLVQLQNRVADDHILARRQSATVMVQSLSRQQQLQYTPRSHVPLWAWAVFAACGVAFGLMALGLFLIRTRTRRGGPGSAGGKQQAMISRRHWKEGEEQLPPPTTYVNLVQMLMPHPKQPPVNMPQQV